MKATIVILKDKNKSESVTLPAPVDGFAYQAFIEKNDLAATVLSELWDDIAKKYGSIDRVEISDFEVTRQIAGEPVAFPATATISNLNMVAMLAKIAERTEAKRKLDLTFADLKALLKQAVNVEVHGYEAGKRGRHAKQGMTQASALELARKALSLG